MQSWTNPNRLDMLPDVKVGIVDRWCIKYKSFSSESHASEVLGRSRPVPWPHLDPVEFNHPEKLRESHIIYCTTAKLMHQDILQPKRRFACVIYHLDGRIARK
jgi:hypothetical protein